MKRFLIRISKTLSVIVVLACFVYNLPHLLVILLSEEVLLDN